MWSSPDTKTRNNTNNTKHHHQHQTDHGTTHLSVVDADRNAVAVTSTINTVFGAAVVSDSLGFPLNNQMDDFSQPQPVHPGDAPPLPRQLPRAGEAPAVGHVAVYCI